MGAFMNDDWYEEQRQREEDLYYKEIMDKQIEEYEKETGGEEPKDSAWEMVGWLIAIIIVAYAILDMMGKI